MILYFAGLRQTDLRRIALPRNVLLTFNDIHTVEGWKVQKKLLDKILEQRQEVKDDSQSKQGPVSK